MTAPPPAAPGRLVPCRPADLFESCLLHLSPEEIAAAEACGISFLPATDAQVQRLAMQRKVFYRNGAPILATRGDGLFETVGTLQPLIEEGLQQQRDLAQWLEAAAPAVEPVVEPGVEPVVEAIGEAIVEPGAQLLARQAEVAPTLTNPAGARDVPGDVPGDALKDAPKSAPVEDVLGEAPVKRPRQRRARPAAFEPWVAATAEEPPAAPDAPPLDTASLVVASPRVASPAIDAVAEERGKRWVVAGAARRGRAGKHWSTRQR